MAHTRSRKLNPGSTDGTANERLARHGLSLPQPLLRALDESGIYCFPGISVEHQHLAQRYVLKGTESGGAVEYVGRYCGYLDIDGHPLPWLQPLDSFGGNGRHAIIIAAEMVRIEMLRVERTYELLISHHTLQQSERATRPQLVSTILFRGRAGTLPAELVADNSRQAARYVSPIFYTNSGEVHASPPKFSDAIYAIAQGVACVRCKHTHVAVAPRSETSSL